MLINLEQIRKDEGLSIHHVYADGELSLQSDATRIVGRPSMRLVASRSGDELRLVGDVQTAVEFECDRCLAPLALPVDQSFDLLYVPPLHLAAADEKELGDDDLTIGFYHNNVINVDDLVREQIELALPMARVCAETCRGLCPDCGANLNKTVCTCAVEEIDPRWAALKPLESHN